MAVEIAVSSDRQVIGANGQALPVFGVYYKPPELTPPENFHSVSSVGESVPLSATSGTYFYYKDVSDGGRIAYLIYDPYADRIYLRRDSDGVRKSVVKYFVDSWAYKKYYLLRNPPQTVVSADNVRITLTQKIVAWLTFCFSVGLSVWLLWECYKTLDRLLWLAHRGYTQRRISSYIDRVARENGGDPLGEGSKSTWERDFGDEPLPKPPGY